MMFHFCSKYIEENQLLVRKYSKKTYEREHWKYDISIQY
jgi:hypothetical protein